MALFIDGDVTSIDTLMKRDHNLLRVAEIEAINLTEKIGLASEVVDEQLQALLLAETGQNWSRQMEKVVVTPALRRLHEAWALALIYEDAYLSEGHERYSMRWQNYTRETREAKQRLRSAGIGIALNPLRRPDSPILSTLPGQGPQGRTQWCIEFVNASGQRSAPSPVAVLDNADGAAVGIRPRSWPVNAVGWLPVGAYSGDVMTCQSATPLDINTAWLAPVQLSIGEPAGEGQSPDQLLYCQNRLTRA